MSCLLYLIVVVKSYYMLILPIKFIIYHYIRKLKFLSQYFKIGHYTIIDYGGIGHDVILT